MAQHNDTGNKGEALAAEFLQKNGYRILATNWRYGNCEIDIIATKNNYLHFFEVKTRTSGKFGFPDDQVSKKKFDSLLIAAEEYLFRHPGWKRIQFDILAIHIGAGPVKYNIIKDVYFW